METNKYIEVADGNFITSKETGEVQIKMRENNIETFIDTLYNAAMKGFPLSSRIFIFISPVYFAVKNAHLQLQNIYLFPPMSLV